MPHLKSLIALLLLLFVASCSKTESSKSPSEPKKDEKEEDRSDDVMTASARHFRFDYGVKLSDVPKNAKVRIWFPVPQSSEHQTIREIDRQIPGETKNTVEGKYQNRILYTETKADESGAVHASVAYDVERKEIRLDSIKAEELPSQQRQLFLTANSKVPVDGLPVNMLGDLTPPKLPIELARTLYNRVGSHMRYDKSKPGYGNGDSVWACQNGIGNCTDFHSLFITLARSQQLPARFEIGFPIPEETGKGSVGGYHCWAFFYDADRGWLPTDISEADKNPKMKSYYFGNLTANRVTFSVGRDIDLVPQQAAKPLNFFVYPHVEVDGEVWPKDKTGLSFSYQDVE
ncbi:MAG: hypothetical protein CMJ78_01335 [Planctomycetaceae bacterium]|nr:hypothetical protein [Planctomycetaceae bacterium]